MESELNSDTVYTKNQKLMHVKPGNENFGKCYQSRVTGNVLKLVTLSPIGFRLYRLRALSLSYPNGAAFDQNVS